MRAALLVLGLAAFAWTAAAQETTDAPEEEDKPLIQFKKAPFKTGSLQRPMILPEIETAARSGARLRQLDKMTGATETFELTTGEDAEFGRLRVHLAACEAPEDNADKGTRAHLTVWDLKTPDKPAFAGWMFADSPALSAMDHPRFDLWVIACTTS
ncbi:MAG: DUF2155 domain-containing protein [Pseudomonadota bacterium]